MVGPHQLASAYAMLGVGLDRCQWAHSASCTAVMVKVHLGPLMSFGD
jgi:hypothetical protein